MMEAFLTSNEWPWRLARTIVQGVLGVVVANVDMLVGCAVLAPEWRAVVVALVMNRSWLASLVRGRGRDGAAADDAAADGAADDAASRLTRSIVARGQEVAAAYALSPRETEVFMLLAQGRTCSFVQEELVLAESTVKTHMSHIYAKLGVHSKQEIIDLFTA